MKRWWFISLFIKYVLGTYSETPFEILEVYL